MKRKKADPTPATKSAQPPGPEAPKPAPTPEEVADAFDRVRERANTGDEVSRRLLLWYLDRHPQLWSHFGSMAKHAEVAIVDAMGGEWFTTTTIKHEASRLRRELAGPRPTQLELLAVERVVLCWLQLNHVEIQFQQSQRDLGWAKYWLRRLEVANKLYKSALDSLATIQGLVAQDEQLRKPAVIDCSSQTQPEPAHSAETAVPDVAENCSIPLNRLRGLEDLPASLQLVDGRTAGVPGMNGHRHQLEELLAKSGL